VGCKFRRQYSVGPYVIDFYSPEVKLAIELDGETHYVEGAAGYDAQREEYIRRFGIKTLRFLNPDVYTNLDGVLEVIAREISQRRGTQQPPPAPPCQGGER
jgi:very-short-patch-repair endonuclease